MGLYPLACALACDAKPECTGFIRIAATAGYECRLYVAGKDNHVGGADAVDLDHLSCAKDAARGYSAVFELYGLACGVGDPVIALFLLFEKFE